MIPVGQCIASHHAEILGLWTDEAERAASARGLSRPELLDIFPEYLSTLGNPAEDARSRRRCLIENHLAVRLRQGYVLPEVVEELMLLGTCISSVCGRAPSDEPVDRPGVQGILLEIQQSASFATAFFVRYLLEDEQAERRYLRVLQTIAAEDRERADRSEPDRWLRDSLAVVLEALHADGGVIALGETPDRLVATVGLGALLPAPEHGEPGGPGSFVVQVASSDSAIRVRDLAAPAVGFNAAVPESGTRALLGARLPPSGALLGVLYVGRRAGTFTARNAVRLETIAAALAVQLKLTRTHFALRDQIRDAERERELRERFVSLLAHDLRTPLSSATSAARLLSDAPDLPEDRREIADRILRGVASTDRMVRDLLDANRIRAGKRLSLTLERCALLEVARDAAAELSGAYGDRFRVEGDEDLVGIWSRLDLHRMVTNLASNAAKYGTPGTPVTITATRTGTGAALTVHNEGPPISPADRAALLLFQPFTRTRAASGLGRQMGWGLGLTLVKGSAEAHGGTIAVDSDVDRGTTFQVFLPLDSTPFQPGPVAIRPASPPPSPLPRGTEDLTGPLLEAAGSLAMQRYPACLVDAAGVIRYVNSAWDRFARENGGVPGALGQRLCGTRWLDHIAGEAVRDHFAGILQAALHGARWPGVVRVGECNTSGKVRMLLSRFERVPASAGAGEAVGVAIHHPPLLERSLARESRGGNGIAKVDVAPDEPVVQCPECRLARVDDHWLFVPELLASPPARVLYELCPECATSYFASPPAATTPPPSPSSG